jgi:hypothetical protein
MNYGAVITAFVIIAAIGLILQGIALIGIYVVVRQVRKRVVGITGEAKQNVGHFVRTASEVFSTAREFKTAAANFADVSRIVRDRTAALDETVGDITQRTRLQVARADQVVSGVFDKVETTATFFHRDVLAPLLEISAIFKAVEAGVDFLFGRRQPSNVREATQDEEMFI